MIEVSLAIAAASQAVSTIKKGLRAGRDAQDLATQFASFFDAKDKIDGAKAQSEHAPLGSKVFAKQSVESYALEVALAEHKTKEMEKVERRRRITDAVLRQMALQAAFRTAIGMSLISMISMEAAMNLVDVLMTGGAKLTWWVIPFMLFAGYVTPLPYNYWRLKALGKGCCH